MYGLDTPSMETSPITRIESAIYGGFYKLAWSVAVGWVIFSSCRGYGGKNFLKICFILLAWCDKIGLLRFRLGKPIFKLERIHTIE